MYKIRRGVCRYRQTGMGFYRYLLVIWSVITTVTVVNASENIASGKLTNQSSVLGPWNSSKAVDGCVLDYISSDCCTHTAIGPKEAWWQVDLQTQSFIETVNVTYRDENTLNRLPGYEIYLSNSSDWTSGTRCHKDTTADLASMSSVQNVPCPGVARYLTIYNDRRVKDKPWYSDDAYMELCEVQVYGCPVGKYGNGNCNNDCLNCANNVCDATSGACGTCTVGYYKVSQSCIPCPSNCVGNTCDSTSGACSDGCLPGFSGLYCRCPVNCRDTTCVTSQCTDCNDGYYGPLCAPCSSGCSTNTCDKTSGHCNLCAVGFHGSFCNQSCNANCKNNICDKDSGQCATCDIGFHGSFCNQLCKANCKNNICDKDSGQCADCEDGYFGSFCDACATGCKDLVCDKISGNCSNCINGYYGSSCAQPCPSNCNGNICIKDKGFCTECVPGLYGSICDQTCSSNCKDNLCNQGNGLCTRCKQGFHGNTCQQRCPSTCKDSICSQFSGQCEECAVGYHGIQCDKICPSNCKDGLCNQTDGRCIGCEADYHGNTCSESCPDNCRDNICMQEDGQCRDCISGFHGTKCSERCGYCQDGRCDKDTGNCMSSCKDGLTGDRCDVKVVVVNVPSNGDDFKPAIGIGIGCGVVIVALVILNIVQARRLHSGSQRDTTRSTTMTDISLPSIEQQLQTETDGTYDVIGAQKKEEDTVKEYPTDDKYERLGKREKEVPHIYENK